MRRLLFTNHTYSQGNIYLILGILSTQFSKLKQELLNIFQYLQ